MKKRYFAAKTVLPPFPEGDADRYLSPLSTIAGGALHIKDSWLSEAPPFEMVSLPHRHVDPAILRATIDAFRERKALEIHYRP